MTADPFAGPAPSAKDVDSFLGGGGSGISCKFPKLNHEYTGIVISKDLQQQRDYDEPDKLKFWRGGKMVALAETEVQPGDKPAMHAILKLVTDSVGTFDKKGNPVDVEDDNGERALFVKSHLQKAIKEAVRAAGAPTVELFSKLTVRYSADGKQSNPKYEAPKLFDAVYVGPDKVAKNDPLLLKALGSNEVSEDDPFAL